MIFFKDFAPQVTKNDFWSTEYESLGGPLAAANEWISEDKIDVVNIETVVLPMVDREGQTTEDGMRSSRMTSMWHQFIRVWYKQ